jgi:hypothetical protein
MKMCTLALAPLIPMAVSTGLGIAQNTMASNETSKAAARTAKRLKQEGDQAYARTLDDVRQQVAGQAVRYAKGGVTSEGTPSDVLSGMARDGDVAARTARDRGYDQARDTLFQARQSNRDRLFDSLRGVTGYGKDLLEADWDSLKEK